MRPVRLILAITTCIFTVLLLSYIAARRSPHVAGNTSGRLHALFDWRSPASLFPPSAIISLTDDNSTFFLARPANFGPLLPPDGLSGPLWIGSGFGEDNLSHGGVASAEGELGCSDVPGWDEGDRGSPSSRNGEAADRSGRGQASDSKEPQLKMSTLRRRSVADPPQKNAKSPNPSEEDGTDDHLHHPLPSSEDPKAKAVNGKKLGHADIQSIQESAEIAGKVVLLSRGGCGFLEKVKWVQRRGGTALIVGDNVRGGVLVTMYAHGETSNVTIPSIFTSYTTAHLLSSLIPSGGRRDDLSIGDARRLGLALGGPESQPQGEANQKKTMAQPKASNVKSSNRPNRGHSATSADRPGWIRGLLAGSAPSSSSQARRPPPGNGGVDWVLQKDFVSQEDAPPRSDKQQSSGVKAVKPTKQDSSSQGRKISTDGFVIGVHDWRDPDLVDLQPPVEEGEASRESASSTEHTSGSSGPKGGSTTPGSGEYVAHANALPRQKAPKGKLGKPLDYSGRPGDSKTRSGRGRTGESSRSDVDVQPERFGDKHTSRPSAPSDQSAAAQSLRGDGPRPHEGLWVTLQPTNMSTSPFFDTLLVLVVSPLVTLTVVYALLLLRSRIRRRRWRAPKSVVDRLPVRTYHTIASSSATTSSANVSPPGTPRTPDQTTPLLHSNARPIGQRPRSRTASEVPVASSSFVNRSEANLSLDQIQEKREAGLMEWRRKYGGRQRECVVCLEEYVDGVSRVMSLPCGHEFHADCITPWLTTRRRTCPICKGDVVRSLARMGGTTGRSNTNEQRYDSYDEHDDEALLDGVQQQAVSAHNDDPDAEEPLGEDGDRLDDLERDAGRMHGRSQDREAR